MPLRLATAAALAAALVASPAHAAERRLAVLEFPGVNVQPDLLRRLSDRARAAAVEERSRRELTVMTRETITLMARENGGVCDGEAECELALARSVGADLFVTGEVTVLRGTYVVDLKLFVSGSGAILAAESARATDELALLDRVYDASLALLRRGLAGSGSATALGAYREQAAAVGGAAEESVLELDTTPPGAVVMLDGQLLCQSTPCARSVPRGPHVVAFERERYRRLERRISVPSSKVEAKLEPAFGWVTVETVPAGLGVAVNGRDAGRTPLVDREVDPGTVEVAVVDPCWLRAGERVAVAAGERRKVRIEAAPRAAGLKVRAEDPAGNAVPARVSVDGRPVGDAGSVLSVPACARKIVVEGAGLRWEGPAALNEGQVAVVTAKLAVPAGDLPDAVDEVVVKFESTPAGAKVLVDGAAVCDRTPCTRSVAVGIREIGMELDHRKPARKKLAIEAAGTIALELEEASAWITVAAEAPGFEVALDGKPVGRAPLTARVTAGEHVVSVADPCWVPASARVTVATGERKAAPLEARPRLAVLRVRATDPAGNALQAPVFVNGREAGQTFAALRVPLCSRSVRVRFDEARSWLTEVRLEEGKVAELTASVPVDGKKAPRCAEHPIAEAEAATLIRPLGGGEVLFVGTVKGVEGLYLAREGGAPSLLSREAHVRFVAADARNIVWSSGSSYSSNWMIRSVPRTGGPIRDVATGLEPVDGVWLAGDAVYWRRSDQIGAGWVTGGPSRVFAERVHGEISDLVVADGAVWWIERAQRNKFFGSEYHSYLMRLDRDGGDPREVAHAKGSEYYPWGDFTARAGSDFVLGSWVVTAAGEARKRDAPPAQPRAPSLSRGRLRNRGAWSDEDTLCETSVATYDDPALGSDDAYVYYLTSHLDPARTGFRSAIVRTPW